MIAAPARRALRVVVTVGAPAVALISAILLAIIHQLIGATLCAAAAGLFGVAALIDLTSPRS